MARHEFRVDQASGVAEVGDEHHAHRHRVAVPPGELLIEFDRVPEGVPIVEDFPQPGFFQVLPHHGCFHRHRPTDEFRQVATIGNPQAGGRVGFVALQDHRVGDEPGLDDLRGARHDFPFGESGQHVQVDEDRRRLVEGAHQVFARGSVHPGFAAHRSIDHGQQGCGHLDHPHAPHPGCGNETGQVGGGSPTDADHHVPAAECFLPQLVPAVFRHREGFAGFGVGDLHDGWGNTAGFGSLGQGGGVVGQGRLGDNGDLGGVKLGGEIGDGAGKIVPNGDGVWAGSGHLNGGDGCGSGIIGGAHAWFLPCHGP